MDATSDQQQTTSKPQTKEGYVTLAICGVDVTFPFEPYPVQKYMMNMTISAIKKAQHCLLESPTGTGKTLGLLCSTLSWQKKERKMIEKLHEELVQEQREKKREENRKLKSAIAEEKRLEKEKRFASAAATANTSSSNIDNTDNERRTSFHQGNILSLSIDDSSDEDVFQPPKRSKKQIGTPNQVFKASHSKEEQASGPVEAERGVGIKTSFGEEGCVEPHRHPNDSKTAAVFDESGDSIITDTMPNPPKIFYGTRTHKQITQVVDQMKKVISAHDVRMTILGAREHSCVNPKVNSKPNITDHCNSVIDPHIGTGCAYYNAATKINTHESAKIIALPQVFDIEDVVAIGARRKVCPYFTLRNLVCSADIVFCPYNYLIHRNIRNSMNIDLKGAIVIMDEAHNIEENCRDAASMWLKLDDLALAIKECQEHQMRKNHPDLFQLIEAYLVKLEEFIAHNGPKEQYSADNPAEASRAIPGPELVDRLHVFGVTKVSFDQMQSSLNTIEASRNSDPDCSIALSKMIKQLSSELIVVFDFLYNPTFSSKYQAFFTKESGFIDGFAAARRGSLGSGMGIKEWKYGLRILCLDPALMFSELLEARTIILASGTLSPLDSFKSELGINFPFIVRGRHVVPSENLYVSTVSSGPTGKVLKGTYEHTGSYEYQDELGRIILETAKIVPHGVLCFVTSYYLMERLRQRWESTNLMENLNKFKKVFWEPRRKEEMTDVLQEFTEQIHESQECPTSLGAILFGVFRGKIAEGIDFSDDNARVVIAVGIPFTNKRSMDIALKMRYNDSESRRNKDVLSGSKWYCIQAYRALNQALGRCIRHQKDWGSIILVDERFALKDIQENLPVWLLSQTRTFRHWNVYVSEINEFCERMKIKAALKEN